MEEFLDVASRHHRPDRHHLGLIGFTDTDWNSTAAVESSLDTVTTSALIIYSAVTLLVQVLFLNHLYVGMSWEFLTAARGDRVEVGGLFRPFTNYWSVVLGLLLPLLAIFIGAGIVVLIVVAVPWLGFLLMPAYWIVCFIVACKLAFLPFLLVDRRLTAIESIRTSWRWTRGYAGKVFVIWLPLLGYIIAFYIIMIVAGFSVYGVSSGVDSTGVGSAVSLALVTIGLGFLGLLGGSIITMWLGTATAWLYHAVRQQKETPVAFPSPMVP